MADDSSSDDDIGPPMPPGFAKAKKAEESSDDEVGPPIPPGAGGAASKAEEESSDEEDVGPVAPPSEDSPKETKKRANEGELPPKKRRKKMQNEDVFLNKLPSANQYEFSYLHRDTLTKLVCTKRNDFVLTASRDGWLKFWKKVPFNIEFAKQYRVFDNRITNIATTVDGELCAVSGEDKDVAIFNVSSFDMMCRITLPFSPGQIEWVHHTRKSVSLLAATSRDNGEIKIFTPMQMKNELARNTIQVHRSPVMILRYNHGFDCCISVDVKGFVEYWNPDDGALPSCVQFKSKFQTDTIDFWKNQCQVTSLEISPNSKMFASLSTDNKFRVFDFCSGKVLFELDESLAFYEAQQMDENSMFKCDPFIYGQRMDKEKKVQKEIASNPYICTSQIQWTSSSLFVLYSSLLGIKVVNVVTKRVVKLIGNGEANLRFINIALFEGIPREVGESEAAVLNQLSLVDTAVKRKEEDPSLFCTAFQSPRFHIITSREPADLDDSGTGRDKMNEKPTHFAKKVMAHSMQRNLGKAAIIHTTYGDIHIKLFGLEAPKAVENFTTLAERGYFDNLFFHRIVKNFMIQTGDPNGDGTGGTSMWDQDFEDEFHRSLKHDRAGTVSMANAGPNTNGSQFFITTIPCPWLDNKHTIFGRVTRGLNIVMKINETKTNKLGTPKEKVNIVQVSIVKS